MLKNYSITLLQHRTSITLEEEFFTALKEIASEKKMSLASLVTEIESEKTTTSNLSSTIRVYVLMYYRRGKNIKSV